MTTHDILQGSRLDDFARAYCESHGQRYDRDLCAIALSGKPAHSVAEASALLDSMFTNRVYLERA